MSTISRAGSRVVGHPWPARDKFTLNSLADAEGREDLAEQVVVAELAGDFPEGVLHVAQFLRGQFTRMLEREYLRCGIEVFARALERGNVARAR